ncbi:MAG: hypothetical protein R2713_06420 [Ilumatobacteraceae bacterium]
MRFANLHGRSILVVADADGLDRAVDIERASDGTLSSDPAVYVDLANHPRLAEVATGVAAGEWPVLDLALLGAPVPAHRRDSASDSTTAPTRSSRAVSSPPSRTCSARRTTVSPDRSTT